MIKKSLGLTAFILTGLGAAFSAAVKHKSLASTAFLVIMVCFLQSALKTI